MISVLSLEGRHILTATGRKYFLSRLGFEPATSELLDRRSTTLLLQRVDYKILRLNLNVAGHHILRIA